MATVKTYGLKKVSSGAVVEDGTMPPVLEELCKTLRDSCEFIEEDPQITEEFSDQEDDAEEIFIVKGGKSIKFSSFDYSPEALVKLKGGTIVDGQWAEPAVMPEIYLAIELLTNTDLPLCFPKCRVFAKFNTKLVKNGLALLEVTLRPLSRGKGKGSILIGKKTP